MAYHLKIQQDNTIESDKGLPGIINVDGLSGEVAFRLEVLGWKMK